MRPATLSQIEEFLKQKRIAMVGISRNPKDYTRNLFSELKRLNYEITPVNPNTDEIEGLKCFKSVNELQPAPDAVMIFTVKTPLETIVDECIKAGVSHIWIHNMTREKEQKNRIYDVCIRNGRNVIIDFCPFMFLSESGFIHKFHGFCMKITGSYPKTQKTVSTVS